MNDPRLLQRRQFLAFLASSPLFLIGATKLFAQELSNEIVAVNPMYRTDLPKSIRSVSEALSLFDFEVAAREILPPAHWGYLKTGHQDDTTVQANRDAFAAWKLRLRRLVDISHIDTQTTLFGDTFPSPILLAPAGSHKAFHIDGELATAKAAAASKQPMILSTMSSTALEEVNAAYGAPVWYQLYAADKWESNRRMIDRVKAAGCKQLVFTVDTLGGRDMETSVRFERADLRDCGVCHTVAGNTPAFFETKPNLKGVEYSSAPFKDWAFVRQLKEYSGMNLLLKGIVTAEDAQLCLENGVDGIIVSNHGGRVSSSGRATLDCLPEIVSVVKGQVPVLIDGGFRRGDDVFKAIALGASAICIGRPYLWGLAAFGQEGVEAVLTMLKAEFQMSMRKAGTPSLSEITPQWLTR